MFRHLTAAAIALALIAAPMSDALAKGGKSGGSTSSRSHGGSKSSGGKSSKGSAGGVCIFTQCLEQQGGDTKVIWSKDCRQTGAPCNERFGARFESYIAAPEGSRVRFVAEMCKSFPTEAMRLDCMAANDIR